MAIAIGIVVLVVLGVIAYMAFYGGDGGTGGGTGGTGDGGGLYGFALAFSADQARRLGARLTPKR